MHGLTAAAAMAIASSQSFTADAIPESGIYLMINSEFRSSTSSNDITTKNVTKLCNSVYTRLYKVMQGYNSISLHRTPN
ncbi:hypothetical protein B5S33_g433 [[Candida] boidinii]|nr:hypothetical protein B5S33_g433 [[Candida] boidinii]